MVGLMLRSYEHRGNARRFAPAAHAELEIAWVERGSATYRIGRSEHAPRIGSAILVPPGVEHATTFGPQMVARSIRVPATLVENVSDVLGLTPGAIPHVIADARTVVALGRTLAYESADGGPAQTMLLEALAESIAIAALRELARRPTTNTSHDPRLARAVDLIHARLAEPLTIDDLACAAGMSRFHFSRVFRAQLGASPYRFLQNARIDRARALLQTTRCSVTEAALSVGITDLGRFSAMFRARVGALPSTIR